MPRNSYKLCKGEGGGDQLPYLPVYNVHPILKPVFWKKAFKGHSWWKIIFWKNSAEMSNLALPAWKSVTGVATNHLMFCLFSDISSFTIFSSFSSAVLLLHNRMQSICTMPVTFLWTRSPGTRLAGHMNKIQDGAAKNISFLFQIFPHLFKKPQDKWVDRTFTKPKGKSFMEFALSSKYSRKCNRFSIMIINKLRDWWRYKAR